MKKNKGFTLIEILVVTTIIVLLTSTAVVTYTAFLKQSRDAKRKADLEQVRAAVEMYRSNNNTYPVGDWSILSSNPGLTAPIVYIQSLPTDPKSTSYSYYYSGSVSDYTLGAYLESGSGSCGVSCTVNCNYSVGPYGQICP